MTKYHWGRITAGLLTTVAATVLLSGCMAKKDVLPADPALADRFLLDRGNETLAKKKWADARTYYRKVVEDYPQSSLRAEAKLGVGETYLGEHSSESLVLAANEFREFLTFYPTSALSDRAQFKLAMTYFGQMHAPERDQTPTTEALSELKAFLDRYPNSSLIPEAKEKWRVARDRLSAASYNVGVTYYKRRWYPGAVNRFREVLKDDPDFSGIDGVYYYLAESLARADNKAEAIPLFDRVVTDYKTSEHFEKAQERLKELQAQ